MRFERYGLGIAKGLGLTFRHLFRHPITTQYPEERLVTSRRIRGNELVWGKSRCTGCGTCAKACPQGAIEIVTVLDRVKNIYEVEKYQVDTGYCIQCGLCVEACPYEALYLGYSYERAKYRRGEVILAGDALLESPKRPASGFLHPEIAEKLPRQTLLLDRGRVKGEGDGT